MALGAAPLEQLRSQAVASFSGPLCPGWEHRGSPQREGAAAGSRAEWTVQSCPSFLMPAGGMPHSSAWRSTRILAGPSPALPKDLEHSTSSRWSPHSCHTLSHPAVHSTLYPILPVPSQAQKHLLPQGRALWASPRAPPLGGLSRCSESGKGSGHSRQARWTCCPLQRRSRVVRRDLASGSTGAHCGLHQRTKALSGANAPSQGQKQRPAAWAVQGALWWPLRRRHQSGHQKTEAGHWVPAHQVTRCHQHPKVVPGLKLWVPLELNIGWAK